MKTQILVGVALLLSSGSALADALTIETADGKKHIFNVEIADTREERARGLMGRENLSPDAGMLFVFEEPSLPQFWMKECRIPLDVVYIGADGLVKGVRANARPFDKTPFPSPEPILAALEIRGKTAETLGIVRGNKVIHKIFEKGLK